MATVNSSSHQDNVYKHRGPFSVILYAGVGALAGGLTGQLLDILPFVGEYIPRAIKTVTTLDLEGNLDKIGAVYGFLHCLIHYAHRHKKDEPTGHPTIEPPNPIEEEGLGRNVIGSTVISRDVAESVITFGYSLDNRVDMGYDNVGTLVLRQDVGRIKMGLSTDTKLYVRGDASANPTYNNGVLSVTGGFEGTVLVPASVPGLMLDIGVEAGSVCGDIYHGGTINISAGDVTLRLYTPLTVHASVSVGDVSVKGMVSNGKGNFTPPGAQPSGDLVLNVSTGDISVEYVRG